MTWPNQKIETNGLQINVYRTGNGEKPPIVMLHGITDNALCWTRTTRDMEANYDVVMIDARGHGDSDKPETGYSPGDHAADVAGVINHLELKRPVLLGHSMGGMVAIHAAAMYPEKLRGIIVVDPPLREPNDIRTPEDRKDWRKQIAERNALSTEDLKAELADSDWHVLEIENWVLAKQQVSPEVVEYAASSHTHWRDLLPRVEVPALLLTGDDIERGAIVTPEIAEEAVNLLPKGQHRLISGTGHNIQREDYDTYLDAVRGFLKQQLK